MLKILSIAGRTVRVGYSLTGVSNYTYRENLIFEWKGRQYKVSHTYQNGFWWLVHIGREANTQGVRVNDYYRTYLNSALTVNKSFVYWKSNESSDIAMIIYLLKNE